MNKGSYTVNGALLIYRHPFTDNAPALKQHINSFTKYSRYRVWAINSKFGFPSNLSNIKFSAIILHYSVFPFVINPKFAEFLHYLKSTPQSLKIAFFQDEHTYCIERFNFINEVGISVIYTLLEPNYHDSVYITHTNCKNIHQTLTGYVDDTLVELSKTLTKSDSERTIDIGYRARELPFFMGNGGHEKTLIANEFIKRLDSGKLILDIDTGESSRLNGLKWYKFVASCRSMIGVEAGASIFDLDGKAQTACKKYQLENPNASFDEVHKRLLLSMENNIYYRAISPRIFECAAFGVCMILFNGRYNGILEPMVHYIPLNKDFSNFDWVIETFNNIEERNRLTKNAYRDLIESGKYSYRQFIKEFDDHLEQSGIDSNISADEINRVNRYLIKDEWIREKKIRISRFLRKLSKELTK